MSVGGSEQAHERYNCLEHVLVPWTTFSLAFMHLRPNKETSCVSRGRSFLMDGKCQVEFIAIVGKKVKNMRHCV